MKRLFLLCVVFAVIAAIVTLAVIFAAWENTAIYGIRANSTVLKVPAKLFSFNCTCLTFDKGYLYHGQDTFEVLKFNIDQSDPSWNVISNTLASAGRGGFNLKSDCHGTDCDIPLILRDFVDRKDRNIGEFVLEQTTVYVIANTESFRLCMYLVGRIIPAEHIPSCICPK